MHDAQVRGHRHDDGRAFGTSVPGGSHGGEGFETPGGVTRENLDRIGPPRRQCCGVLSAVGVDERRRLSTDGNGDGQALLTFGKRCETKHRTAVLGRFDHRRCCAVQDGLEVCVIRQVEVGANLGGILREALPAPHACPFILEDQDGAAGCLCCEALTQRVEDFAERLGLVHAADGLGKRLHATGDVLPRQLRRLQHGRGLALFVLKLSLANRFRQGAFRVAKGAIGFSPERRERDRM